MRRIVFLSAGAIALCIFTPLAQAQEEAELSPDEWIVSRLDRLNAEKSLPQVKQMLWQYFAQFDIDGGGVTQRDFELARDLHTAQRRAGRIAEYLKFDLNSDQIISTDELAIGHGLNASRPLRSSGVSVPPTEMQRQTVLDGLIKKSLEADADKDGQITIAEIVEHLEAEEPGKQFPERDMPKSFDLNSDGTINPTEFDAVLERVFAKFDTNNDFVLSTGEALAIEAEKSRLAGEQSRRRARASEEAAFKRMFNQCAVERPEPGDQVVYINGNNLDGIAQAVDVKTGYAPVSAVVEIEEGSTPLYVIASSSMPTVWKFTGSTARVRRLIVAGSGGREHPGIAAGVSGLEKGRTVFAPQRSCFVNILAVPNKGDPGDMGGWSQLLGRKADVVISAPVLWSVSLPSGKVIARAPKPTAVTSQSKNSKIAEISAGYAKRPSPAIIELDAASFVSSGPIQISNTKPGQAGLMDLVSGGVLEVVSNYEVLDLDGDTIVTPPGMTAIIEQDGTITIGGIRVTGVETLRRDGGTSAQAAKSIKIPQVFRILKKTDLPPQPFEGVALEFKLAERVPIPTVGGVPIEQTRLCIVSEGTGRSLTLADVCTNSKR